MAVRNGLTAVIYVSISPPKEAKSGAAPPQGSFEPIIDIHADRSMEGLFAGAATCSAQTYLSHTGQDAAVAARFAVIRCGCEITKVANSQYADKPDMHN